MSLSATLAPRAAGGLAATQRHVRELQRIGPQPRVYVGTFPTDPFTRAESPEWQNNLVHATGHRVTFRWGIDGTLEVDGVFDLTQGYVSGDVGLNINQNTLEFEGEGFESFIPLELDVGVYSAAVVRLYPEDLGVYVAGDLAVFYPIVADPIP